MPPEPTESPEPVPTPPEPFPREPIPPEVLAWARETFDLDEFMADVREVMEGRGVPLESFIHELEALARES